MLICWASDQFTNSIGITFILITAGQFKMGSPLYEPGRDDDELKHDVTLTKPFYMQSSEITRAQCQEIFQYHKSLFAGTRLD